MSMEEARKPENLPRNRYRDILPCENLSLSIVLLFLILLMGPFLCSVLAMKKFQIVFELFTCTDDDTRCKLYKGKNDYINANYVTVSVTREHVTTANEEIKLSQLCWLAKQPFL